MWRTLGAPALRLDTPACRRSRPAATRASVPRMQVSGGWSSAAGDGSSSNGGGGGGGGGQMEEIEFIVHSDGRVEETVRGVKGRACNELTDAVNEKLGVVMHTEETQEAFEQQTVVVNEQQNTQGVGGGGGMPSW